MALDFVIGGYKYFGCSDLYHLTSSEWSDPNYLDVLNSVKSYDHLLHQSLRKIFRHRCLSSSSSQIEEILHSTNQKSIIEPILEKEPCLSRHFSKEELGKLSLLWIAVLAGYTDSAELLVRSGADVNELFGRHDPQVIYEKSRMIHVLLQMDFSPEKERLIRLLIDHGADLQARDCRGQSVLHYALRADRVKVVEMLLEKNADVNAADDDGVTPLFVAVSKSTAIELVPLLMKYRANVFAKNRIGQNVLHCLANGRRKDNVNLARILIEKGVSLEDKEHFCHFQPIHHAVQLTNGDDLVELYLDHGADVNAPSKIGETPLHIAAVHKNDAAAETLLKRGANINLRTKYGSTALHDACEQRIMSEKLIRLLLSAGADVLAEDCDGMTPFALINFEYKEQPGSRLLIEKLALQKKVYQPSIELKDEAIIELYPDYQNYYQKCIEEIEKMKVTRIIRTCTFFELLTKSRCRIVALMRNPEFEINFKNYDVTEFTIYAEDILRAFERARSHYNSLLEIEDVINEAVYDSLPYLIVRKVAHYTLDCYDNTK